jgi:hypothetical protein
MFIVPLFPALFANRLLADRTSHTRGSAPLSPILCTQFSSELLSVTHPTITPRYHPKTHPHVGTLIRRIVICGILVHFTMTTGRRVGSVIIRTHREREIVLLSLLGMRSRSCESVRYCLWHALATSIGRGKLCEHHFLVKFTNFFSELAAGKG